MESTKNGVLLEPLQQFVAAIAQNNALADVKFMAKSVWKGGTQSEVTIDQCLAAGQNVSRPDRKFTLLMDEPAPFGGKDQAPNPIEYLAAALCGCITAGIATNAALFDTTVERIDVTVEAEMNLLGFLGMDHSKPSACNKINYQVVLSGPNGEKSLLKSKEIIDRKSPVRNTLAAEMPITTSVELA